ncbi:MAG: hypothetical protein JST80_13215 [Bdellovibrionales bacterium]|nr:hypothetical protein [Bdellovibrionales bacterium]
MKKLLLVALTVVSLATASHAEISKGDHRFGLTGGVLVYNNQTSFSLSAEYEYRVEPIYGIGFQAAHVFATSSFTQLAIPTFYLHPFQGSWYISASPVFYFGGGRTLTGARFTTRMPLDIDILTLTPVFGVDLIEGGPNYIFGLGVSI